MTTSFQINDPSLESQWRAIILFGKNSATYKFAFAKSLLEIAATQTNRVKLEDLAKPFVTQIVNHLRSNDKQGSSSSSKFLNGCRSFVQGQISESELNGLTVQ